MHEIIIDLQNIVQLIACVRVLGIVGNPREPGHQSILSSNVESVVNLPVHVSHLPASTNQRLAFFLFFRDCIYLAGWYRPWRTYWRTLIGPRLTLIPSIASMNAWTNQMLVLFVLTNERGVLPGPSEERFQTHWATHNSSGGPAHPHIQTRTLPEPCAW